jgi:hypothetical protein
MVVMVEANLYTVTGLTPVWISLIRAWDTYRHRYGHWAALRLWVNETFQLL